VTTCYTVVSPDGLPIVPTTFPSRARAEHALEEWCARYAAQGYYATADGRRIPVVVLADHCRIEAIHRKPNRSV